MKRIVPIVLWVLVALLAACTSKKQVPEPVEWSSKELTAIDSLMWQQPDSALMRLLPWFDTCCRDAARHVSTATAYDRHYANLLLSELLYKNDNPQFNRSDLLLAVAYFDSLIFHLYDNTHTSCRHCGLDPQSPTRNDNLPFLAARAHYMNGVGYYENDSAVPACKEYMKALEIMEDHFKEKDLVGHKAQFMALVYTRLTDLFSRLYLHEQTVYFSRQSLSYYKKQNVPIWYLSRMLCEIGAQYDMLEQLDSADIYYQKAVSLLNDTNCLLYKDLAARQSFLSYKKRNTTENSLKQLYKLIGLANSEMEYLSRCLTIGGVFYYEKRYDSAFLYLDKVFHETTNDASKKQAAEWLVEICKIEGRGEQAFEYAEYLAPFANQEENQSAIKSQLTELYNTFKISALDQQHRQVMQKSKTRAIAVLCSLLVVILVITLLFHRNKKKLKQFESVEHDESEIQAKAWDKYTSFIEEPVCQDIIRSVQGENIKRLATPKDYPDLVMSEEQLQQLAFMVNRYFGPFEYHLEQHGVKASPIMSSLCHLFLLGIDEKQAAILLDRDYSSISRYVKKLKTAFGTQESLSVYFRNLVLNN